MYNMAVYSPHWNVAASEYITQHIHNIKEEGIVTAGDGGCHEPCSVHNVLYCTGYGASGKKY